MTITVIASLQVREGAGEQLEELVAQAREHVLAEPGCARYDLQRHRKDPQRYVMIESWADRESLTAHGQAPAYTEFAEKSAGLLAAPPQIDFFEPIGGQVGQG